MINPLNSIAQQQLSILPDEVINDFIQQGANACFCWHWQALDDRDDFYVFAFTDDGVPLLGEQVLVKSLEKRHSGQADACRIITRYSGQDDARRIVGHYSVQAEGNNE